jgi:hypothetical protein
MNPGYGGPGRASSITGTSVYYAGGGGGGGSACGPSYAPLPTAAQPGPSGSPGAPGGQGGGGSGGPNNFNNAPASYGAAIAGALNTGGGGGGGNNNGPGTGSNDGVAGFSYYNWGNSDGSPGGPGIVIIRY